MTDNAWVDIPPGAGMKPCACCGKETKSHIVCVDDEGDTFVPASEDDFDHLFSVCHACYRDHDGDAESVVDVFNESRSEVLDGVGLTPDVIHDIQQAKFPEGDRVKAVGASSVTEMVFGLEPGDIVTINDEREWFVAPVEEETREMFKVHVIYALLSVGEDAGAGAFVRGYAPVDGHVAFARMDEPEADLSFEAIESVEHVGRMDADVGGLPFVEGGL